MNRFEIKGPTFRHSDLKLIGRRINIEKHNNYYLNITKNLKNNFKEFKSKRYSLVDHDNKTFTGKSGLQFIKRSDIALTKAERHAFIYDAANGIY